MRLLVDRVLNLLIWTYVGFWLPRLMSRVEMGGCGEGGGDGGKWDEAIFWGDMNPVHWWCVAQEVGKRGPGYWRLTQRRGNGVRMLDDGLLGSTCYPSLLAFVPDFGWTCWWTYVRCFGQGEKNSIMPIQQSSIALFWVCSIQC
eukprot:scaffold39174_cov30-Attheya_sp.AAC.3